MEVRQGYSYHIKNEFFDLVKDKYLMSNKEDGNYRPHFLVIQDNKNKELYWMIPISSQVKKYKKIIEKKMKLSDIDEIQRKMEKELKKIRYENG